MLETHLFQVGAIHTNRTDVLVRIVVSSSASSTSRFGRLSRDNDGSHWVSVGTLRASPRTLICRDLQTTTRYANGNQSISDLAKDDSSILSACHSRPNSIQFGFPVWPYLIYVILRFSLLKPRLITYKRQTYSNNLTTCVTDTLSAFLGSSVSTI